MGTVFVGYEMMRQSADHPPRVDHPRAGQGSPALGLNTLSG